MVVLQSTIVEIKLYCTKPTAFKHYALSDGQYILCENLRYKLHAFIITEQVFACNTGIPERGVCGHRQGADGSHTFSAPMTPWHRD